MKYFGILLIGLFFTACKNDPPSEKDVLNKMMLELVCPQSARITHFEIVQHDELQESSKKTVHRYLVRGQVSWPDGCHELGDNYVRGREQSFEQTVFLSRSSNGSYE